MPWVVVAAAFIMQIQFRFLLLIFACAPGFSSAYGQPIPAKPNWSYHEQWHHQQQQQQYQTPSADNHHQQQQQQHHPHQDPSVDNQQQQQQQFG
jgi:hypothetical protein